MAFDSSVISFTTKTDKVDLVQAAHMNAVQAELVTIETILGTNVKGDRADLKTRLNNALDADGSILSGTSYPSPALPSQMFHRTDLGLVYLRNAANTTWDVLGSSLSNVIFTFAGQVDGSSTSRGKYKGTSLVIASGTFEYEYWVVKDDTFLTVIETKWVKISGVSTLTVHARIWVDSTAGASHGECQVNCGGQTGYAETTSTTPGWVTFTIDVSSLTNGTAYTVDINLRHSSSGAFCYLGSIAAFGS